MNSKRHSQTIENSAENAVFAFDEYVFDAGDRILWRDGEIVALPPKTRELLGAFVENAGQVLSKDDLMALVWKDTFVEEANLSHHIAVLRKALGDSKNENRFIQTISRKGYRFIAPINESLNDTLEITVRKRTLTEIIEEREIEVALEEIGMGGAHTPKQLIDGNQPRQKNRVLIGFIALLIIVTGLAGYWLFLRKSPIIFNSENVKRLTTNGRATAPKISPDGRYILYIQRTGSERSIWIRQIATSSDVQITPPTPTTDIYGGVTFSRDGEYVYYSLKRSSEKYSTLYQVPTLGGTPKKILESLLGAVSFSPDGKRFAFLRAISDGDYALFTVNADGTDEKQIASRKRPNHFSGAVSWSPDGNTILCPVFNTEGGFHYDFIAVRIADGDMKKISSRNWLSAESNVWLPDGNSFLMIGQSETSALNQIWQVSYSGGETKQLTNDTNHYGSIGLSGDGRFLVANKLDEESHIWQMNLNQETDARQLTIGDNNYDGLNGIDLMPDGQILYHSKVSGSDAVWMITPDGKDPHKITDNLGGGLTVSPDGRYVVYQNKENGTYGLWRADTNDGGNIKRLTEGVDFTPSFSPDGQWIYYSRFQDQTNLWRVSIEGGEAQLVTNEFSTTSSPSISPDGKMLAIAYGGPLNKTNSPPQSGLALINLENHQILKTFDVPEFKFGGFYEQPTLQWTPDSNAVNFTVLREGVSNIWRQPVAGGNRIQVTNFKDGRIFNFSFSADGQQIALSRGTVTSDVVLIENGK